MGTEAMSQGHEQDIGARSEVSSGLFELPEDLLGLVAWHLAASGDGRALANLAATCTRARELLKQNPELLAPWLASRPTSKELLNAMRALRNMGPAHAARALPLLLPPPQRPGHGASPPVASPVLSFTSMPAIRVGTGGAAAGAASGSNSPHHGHAAMLTALSCDPAFVLSRVAGGSSSAAAAAAAMAGLSKPGKKPSFTASSPAPVSAAATAAPASSTGPQLPPPLTPEQQAEWLCCALEAGWEEAVRILLSPTAGLDPNYRGGAPLRAAAAAGNAAAVSALLSMGARADAQDSMALARAAGGAHVAVMEMLLAAGCDANAGAGRALMAAVSSDSERAMEAVTLLLSRGASVHASGNAALRKAAQQGDVVLVRGLIAAGADVHALRDDALYQAAKGGHAEVVQVLLDAGADRHCPLAGKIAQERGHFDVLTTLGLCHPRSSKQQRANLKPVARGPLSCMLMRLCGSK